MTDKYQESLSALIDNEADELECRRLIRHLDEDAKSKMSRFSMVSHLLQGQKKEDVSWRVDVRSVVAIEVRKSEPKDHVATMLSENTVENNSHDELSDKEVDPNSNIVVDKPSWHWGQMVMAASIMFVFVVSFVLIQQSQSNSVVNEENLAVNRSLDDRVEVNLLTVADNSTEALFSSVDLPTEIILSGFGDRPVLFAKTATEAQRNKLSEYLLRHAGNGFIGSPQGVASYARLVSFSSEGSR